nr:type II secretion system F family protein [Ramlibacter agri]
MDAASEDDARKKASAEGYDVLRCDRDQPVAGFGVFARFTHRSVDAISFAQDLSTLLAAGITIKESVGTLARRAGTSRHAQVLRELQASISHGLRLSQAMEVSGAFSPLLIATVAASEQTGDVPIGLSRFARHQQNLRALRDKVLGACAYPALLLVFGSIVLMVLLGLVVPRFAQVLDVSNRRLPELSKLLMAWGRFAADTPAATPVMIALVLGSLGFIAVILASQRHRHWLLERVPGVKTVSSEFQLLQAYRAAAILTSRGIPIHRALEYTFDHLGPRPRAQLKRGLASIREGTAISTALGGSGFADEMVASMLGVAERTGALPEMLDRIGDLYERTLQRNVDIASRLVEPVLMIVFGALIGGVVLLMYLPIFDLASSVT